MAATAKQRLLATKADGACHQPTAQSDLCDPGQQMYQIHGQLACNPAFYPGHRAYERPHLLLVHPGRDPVHFCEWRDSQGTREHSASEQVCASKETEAKDHWILDKKNKQLIRAHITPRKALFTPTGTKECPVNRTAEIIDASEGGDPEILEDNWRLTSQANKPLINLWTGKTIFTFGDDAERQGIRFRIGSRQDHRQEGPVDY